MKSRKSPSTNGLFIGERESGHWRNETAVKPAPKTKHYCGGQGKKSEGRAVDERSGGLQY
jgi:hypothetical protein